MSDHTTTTITPCRLCGSTEHAFCGFCSRCKEHAQFTSESCETCEGQGIVLANQYTSTQEKPCPDCNGEGRTEPLSECCGASGYAYDHDPT